MTITDPTQEQAPISGALAFGQASAPDFADISAIDKKLRRVTAVESVWGLPSLPDDVKFDLVTQRDADHNSIGEFLHGLASDLNSAVNPFSAEQAGASTLAAPAPVPGGIAVPQQNPLQLEARKLWTDVRGGFQPLQITDPNSVIDFKTRAVSMGLLDKNRIDDQWLPSDNVLRTQMLHRDVASRLSGNKLGATTFEHVGKTIGDWFTPSGLMHAAVHLDMLPDFKRWADFAKKPTAGHLFGALVHTAIPVVNDLLMFTGVGEVVVTAKVATGTFEAFEGLNDIRRTGEALRAARGLERVLGGAGEATGLLRTAGIADAASLTEPGVVARTLGRFGKTAGLADKMGVWRDYTASIVARKGLQVGMRAGFAGRVEHALGYEGDSTSIATAAEHIDALKSFRTLSPIVGVAADTLLAPAHIFRPGLIGEGAGVLSSALRSHFTEVSKSQALTAAFHKGLTAALTDDAAQAYADVVKTHGPSAAVNEFFGGNQTTTGAAISHITHAAAVEYFGNGKAESLLGAASRTKTPSKFSNVKFLYRNKAIAQLRSFEEDDMVTYSMVRGRLESPSNKAALKRARDLLSQTTNNPAARAEAQAWIRHHNDLAAGFSQRLLDNLPEGYLSAYVTRIAPTFGRWGEFNDTMSAVHQFEQAGLLGSDIRYRPSFSDLGRRLSAQVRSKDVNLSLHYAPPHVDDIPKVWFSPLARPVNPGEGALGVMAADEVSKNDILEWVSHVGSVKRYHEAATFLANNSEYQTRLVQPLLAKAAAEGRGISEISSTTVRQWVRDLVPRATPAGPGGLQTAFASLKNKKIDDTLRLLRWADREGVDISEAQQKLGAELSHLDTHPAWSEMYGITSDMKLDDKLKEALRKSQFMAAEIDPETVPEALRNRLASSNYKLVHGVEFLHPHDLAHSVEPFASVTRRDLHRMSLGSFFERQEPAEVFGNRMRRLHDLLRPTYRAVDPQSADVDQAVSRLSEKVTQLRESALGKTAEADRDYGFLGRTLTNLSLKDVPYTIWDLTKRQVEEAFAAEGVEHAHQVFGAVRESSATGFGNRGLVSVEDYLRSKSVNGTLVAGLKLLSKTPSAERLSTPVRWAKMAGVHALPAVAGGVAASTAARIADPDNNSLALGAGLAGAAVGAVGGPKVAAKSARLLEDSNWAKYSYLSDNVARWRDYLRFSLNPMFDARRYAKGWVLAHTAELPGEIRRLPALTSMNRFAAEHGQVEAARIRGLFKAAGQGEYDPDLLETAGRWFNQRGMWGYDPVDKMVATFGHLVKQDVDPERAYQISKGIYSYGVKGRSAAELSTNFLFFPFSFEKKLTTHLGKFMAHDLGRAAILHDTLKLYEVLNDRYDLSKFWEEHLPVLQDLQKLNAFDHGFSLGELGGINKPVVDAAKFLFSPSAVMLKHPDDWEHLRSKMDRIIPAFNDIDHLTEDLIDQQHVLVSPSHKTARGEAQAGWSEYGLFKDEMDKQAKAHGYAGFSSIASAKFLAPLKVQVDLKKAQLGRKYPGWEKARVDALTRRATLEQELTTRTSDPKTEDDQLLKVFDDAVEVYRQHWRQYKLNIDQNPEDIPASDFRAIRTLALQLAERGHSFEGLYKKFYQKQFGPIQRSY